MIHLLLAFTSASFNLHNHHRFEEHDERIVCIAFSEDERVIATVDSCNKVLFWDLSNGAIIAAGKLPSGTNVSATVDAVQLPL